MVFFGIAGVLVCLFVAYSLPFLCCFFAISLPFLYRFFTVSLPSVWLFGQETVAKLE